MEEIKTTEQTEKQIKNPIGDINWNEAISSSGFVKLDDETEKRIGIVNWRFERVNKFEKEVYEFVADVVWEDGKVVPATNEKVFTTTSNRLKMKLRPVLEVLDNKSIVYLSIIKVGDKYDTQYVVKQIPKP